MYSVQATYCAGDTQETCGTYHRAAAPAPRYPLGGSHASGPAWPQPTSTVAKYRLKFLYTSATRHRRTAEGHWSPARPACAHDRESAAATTVRRPLWVYDAELY